MVTIKDIAKLVGVAPSTVGRALADHRHVREDTKRRVRAAAAQLGYVAHAPARMMRGARSTLVGLMIPDVRNDFYSTAAQAIVEACAHAGFQVVLSVTSDDARREFEQLHNLASARAAGVIIVPTAHPSKDTLALLARLPHVQLVRRHRSIRAPWFGIDDAAATRLASEHLLALGHRRVGYIGGDPGLGTAAERFRGYAAALAAVGLRVPSRLCAHGHGDAAFGERAAVTLLEAAAPPTALVLAGSRLTLGALEAIRRLGVAVPGSLSVVGFNDSAALGWWGSGVTSIGLPVFDIALGCAAGLLGALQAKPSGNDAPDRPPSQVMFAPFLVERGSTAPSARTRRARHA